MALKSENRLGTLATSTGGEERHNGCRQASILCHAAAKAESLSMIIVFKTLLASFEFDKLHARFVPSPRAQLFARFPRPLLQVAASRTTQLTDISVHSSSSRSNTTSLLK